MNIKNWLKKLTFGRKLIAFGAIIVVISTLIAIPYLLNKNSLSGDIATYSFIAGFALLFLGVIIHEISEAKRTGRWWY